MKRQFRLINVQKGVINIDVTNLHEVGSAVAEPNVYTLSDIQPDNTVNLLENGSVVSTIDLSPYLDNTNLPRVVSGTLDGETGMLTLTRDDASTFDINLSNLLGEAFIEGTYDEIVAIRDAQELKPGVRYIINDYQTEYFIKGSNSSGIVEEKEITANISGWAVLDDNYEYDLGVGDTVEITELPSGYGGGLVVGDTTTVSSENADYYFKFANGMQSVVGLKFKFFMTRYSTIAQDAIINDGNGKPVMRPQGIINTEVHDGTDYMEQTAAENLAVPVERIVLTAATFDTFEEVGYSETFDNDVIYYDIDDDEILNDNNEVIGDRTGFIYRRSNPRLDIDAAIDWRVFRFRRWLIDTDSRTNLINQDLDVNTTRVGFDGKFLFTSENRTNASINPFYVAKTPEAVLHNIDEKALRKEFTIVVESNIHAKDFNVFQLDSSYNPVNVDKFKSTALYDTVFMGLGGEFNYNLYVEDCILQGSTFASNIRLFGTKMSMYDCTMLDSFATTTSFNCILQNVISLSNFSITRITNSRINGAIFGTQKGGDITGTPVPDPSAKWFTFQYVDNCDMKNVVMGQASVYLCMDGTQIFNSSVFLYYSPENGDGEGRERVYVRGSVLSNVCLTVPRNVTQVGFNNLYFGYSNSASSDGLFIYDMSAGSLVKKNISKNDSNNNLYYESIDANNQKTITTLVSPTLTP